MTDKAQKTIKPLPLKLIYYFYGAEDLLIEEAIDAIKLRALTGGMAALNFQVFAKGGLDAAAIIQAAMTMPAFSDWRVVLVKDAEALKITDVRFLMDYIKNPSPSTCLILASNAAKVDKKTELIKLLEKGGYLRAFGRLGDRELIARAKKDAAREGKAISDSAEKKLVTLSGGKLRELKGELEKIILFAGDKAAIDVSDVEDAGLDCREETMFGLSDAIGSKDVKTALRIYGKVSTEPWLMVVGAIARQVRILLKIKALERSGVERSAIAWQLGIYPGHFEGYHKRSALFDEMELKAALMKLRKVDVVLKTGRMPERIAMSKLIIDLCGAGAGR